MAKNIVICSDGTNNTFDKGISNVTRLIQRLAVDERQIVVYDQGIGTNASRLKAFDDHHRSIGSPDFLQKLPGPEEWWFYPAGLLARIIGLAFGYGFRANVREMYQKLSELYDGPDDSIYLFGFSRGAFTVRALAGLIYRCGLPGREVENFGKFFREAYRLYKPIHWDPPKIAAFRRKHPHLRDPEIHFLGVWDTVKSYGGLVPILLPHLRHNPMVKTVRHALALDERRSWFNATTWGRLDLDHEGAMLRLTQAERDAIEQQKIEEVWFRGCHSDVGGGDAEEATARAALHWMLEEAAAAGIRLNDTGRQSLEEGDAPGPVEIHESLRCLWWVTEYLPRWEIDNSGEYPVRKFRWGRTGRRNPSDLRRDGQVLVHTSVSDLHPISAPVAYRPVRPHG